MRVARSRQLVAEGYALAAVARVMQVSRQALYRRPKPKTAPKRRPPTDPVEAAIVEEALANQTDGYRMICAFVRRRLGVAVNRKRVLRVMRERKLIQRRRPLERRRRPGFFRVERPRQLWQLDPKHRGLTCQLRWGARQARSLLMPSRLRGQCLPCQRSEPLLDADRLERAGRLVGVVPHRPLALAGQPLDHNLGLEVAAGRRLPVPHGLD